MWKERRPQRRQSVCDLFCGVVNMVVLAWLLRRGWSCRDWRLRDWWMGGYERDAFRKICNSGPVSFAVSRYPRVFFVPPFCNLPPPIFNSRVSRARLSRITCACSTLSSRLASVGVSSLDFGGNVPSSFSHGGRSGLSDTCRKWGRDWAWRRRFRLSMFVKL